MLVKYYTFVTINFINDVSFPLEYIQKANDFFYSALHSAFIYINKDIFAMYFLLAIA